MTSRDLSANILPHQLRRLRLSWGVVFFTLSILVIAWVVVSLELNNKRDAAIDAEIRQNTNLARVLQEQTLRVLASIDQATLRMRDSIAAGEFSSEMSVRFANETGLVPDILTQLAFVGPDGRFVGSNLDPKGLKVGNVDLSEREHVRAHLKLESIPDAAGQFSSTGLYVGKPVLGKVSGKWTIQLSRRVDGPDGRVLGVIVASLNPSYLEDVYGRVQLGASGVVTLVGDDRTLRARVLGGQPKGMGMQLPDAYQSPSRSGAREGHELRTSSIDLIERIVAYHRVGDYPLLLLVGSTVDHALSEWRGSRRVTLVLTGLFSLAVLGTALVFIGALRRLETTNHALALSEAQAQSANQAKSEFLTAVSHELRTPLTSIRGFAELMERRLDDPRYREQAGLIRKAAEHLNALLTEILDFSKVEAGAMPIHSDRQVLADLLHSTADFFAVTAADKGLKLEVRMAPDAPATLMCDGLRIKQILNNLLSNAMKFTKEGSVTLALDATPDSVCVHVIDTGPGIPVEQQELIFERFRQGGARVSYEHGGTGLGLALSRALAELMGGTLTVQSQPGQGSQFTLSLPRHPA